MFGEDWTEWPFLSILLEMLPAQHVLCGHPQPLLFEEGFRRHAQLGRTYGGARGNQGGIKLVFLRRETAEGIKLIQNGLPDSILPRPENLDFLRFDKIRSTSACNFSAWFCMYYAVLRTD